MKLGFLPADVQSRHDGVMHDRLWSQIPDFFHGGDPDVTIVPISYFADFQFNPALRSLEGKKWILADTLETYGQWPDGKSHLFGISDTLPFGGNNEWCKFSSWVRDNPPALQLVRELYKPDVSKFIQPLEWPCYLPAWAVEHKGAFDSRPFEVFFQWGFSHCSRANLHGEFFKNWCSGGHEVISNLDHIDAKVHDPVKKIISIHTPHTHRVDVNHIVRRQAQSKMVVSIRGAGYKCFRHGEMVHSVPAIHSPNLAWSFDWVDGENCMHLQEGNEYNCLMAALKWDRLYDLYVAAQANLDNYRMPNYWDMHIRPKIESVL